VRFDRVVGGLFCALLCAACPDQKAKPEVAPERFAGVKKAVVDAGGASSFCDKTYGAKGANARKYVAPPLRPLPGAKQVESSTPAKGWTWLNLWATWCTPCVDEMGLLIRWKDALARDGHSVAFEMLSIDETSAEKELAAWKSKQLAGPIRWLRSDADLNPVLESLGIEKGASIPIHALIDPSGQLRCTRVGAIHDQDYGAVRDLLGRASGG
jgi:thiol-disulfide isomerase/thioredoxin